MPILKPSQKRLDIPGEPGEFVVIRRLSSLGSLDSSKMTYGSPERLTELGRFLSSGIVEWSYKDEPTIDVIAGIPNKQGVREGGLHPKTSLWLLRELNKYAEGEETDADRFPGTSTSTGS
jgi:hypothetical protein